MTQQYPQPQSGAAFEQASGQQQTHQQGGQFRGRLGPQQRDALAAVAQAIEVCSWCADQCIQEADPNMIECIRLCEDVTELGEATLSLASRNSRFAGSTVQQFQQAVQACAQECGRHQAGHCQECARVLSRTVTAIPSLSQQAGQQPFQ